VRRAAVHGVREPQLEDRNRDGRYRPRRRGVNRDRVRGGEQRKQRAHRGSDRRTDQNVPGSSRASDRQQDCDRIPATQGQRQAER
jgi:hypothetical protein